MKIFSQLKHLSQYFHILVLNACYKSVLKNSKMKLPLTQRKEMNVVSTIVNYKFKFVGNVVSEHDINVNTT